MPRRKSSLKTVQIKKPTMRHVQSKLQSQKLTYSKKKLFSTLIVMDFFHGQQKRKNILFLEQTLQKMDLVPCPECKLRRIDGYQI